MQIAANTGPDNNVISMTCKVNDVGLCKNTQVPTQTTTDHITTIHFMVIVYIMVAKKSRKIYKKIRDAIASHEY